MVRTGESKRDLLKYEYDAFLSYRRHDATGVAQWIRNRLRSWRLPPEVLSELRVDKQELYVRRPQIWLDTSYEKSSDDFLINKVFPALDRSARLIVVLTPAAFEKIESDDGKSHDNWLVREVDHFLGESRHKQSVRPVDVVFGPGAIEGQYPGRLSKKLRWDWIDLRSLTTWRSRVFSEALDDGLTKLVASLYDVPERLLPVLRREERRRRHRTIMAFAAAGFSIAAVTTAIAIWGFIQKNEAEANARAAIMRETVALSALSTVAAQKGQYRDALQLALAAWPKKNDAERPMLRRVVEAFAAASGHRREVLRFAHTTSVMAIAFSLDGKRIATGLNDGTVRIWDARTGAQIGKVMSHEDDEAVNFLAFSPNGARLVSASDDGFGRLWDATTGVPIGKALEHDFWVKSAAFSPDGMRVLTASADNTARLWDANTGDPVGESMTHEGVINLAVFSPDGALVLTASDDESARLWDSSTGTPVGKPMMHEGSVISAAFSAGGARIATAGDDGTAKVWDTVTQVMIGQPMKHQLGIVHVVFSPDGKRVLTASDDYTSRLWNAETGEPVGKAMRHLNTVNFAAYSPDGAYIVTASSDNTAQLWDGKTGMPIGEPLNHDDRVTRAIFSPDGTRVLTASYDNSARIWVTKTNVQIGNTMLHSDEVSSASFSPDGTLIVTASDDNTARLWDGLSGAPSGAPMEHKSHITSARFSQDGTRIVTASDDETSRLWNARSGLPIGDIMKHDDRVTSAVFSPDGTRVLTASLDKTARLWDARTGAPIGEQMKYPDDVISAVFSPGGTRILIAFDFHKAQLRNADTWASIGEPFPYDGLGSQNVFSPDDKWFLDPTIRKVTIRNAETGAPAGLPIKDKSIRFTSYSPDGKLILIANNSSLQMYDAQSMRAVGVNMAHGRPINMAQFSPNNDRIVTASADNTARVWDTITGAPVGDPIASDNSKILTSAQPTHDTVEFISFHQGVDMATFSPDGKQILTASGNSAQIFAVPDNGPAIGFALGCAMLGFDPSQYDLTYLEKKYGLNGLKPICGENTPLDVDWSNIE